MFLRFCVGIIMLASLTGCATFSNKPSVDQLELRVARLEEQLSYKDDEIRGLKYEIDELEGQMAQMEAKARVSKTKTTTVTTTKKTGTIRVAVSTEKVQKALKNAGFYNGSVDGKIGDGTRSAIAEFQKAHNLKSDGIVGQQTWKELEAYLE